MNSRIEIHDLIDRLSRLHAAGMRADDLNPTQIAALNYLARANRFSRSPSMVADYLATTRGTASQTVKTLVRKGMVEETAVAGDKRALLLSLTDSGRSALRRNEDLIAALESLPDEVTENLHEGLKTLAQSLLSARGGRSFGVCRGCCHHVVEKSGAYCALLKVTLLPEEADQICFEYAA